MDVEDGYQHSEALYIKNLTCQASPTHGLGSDRVNLVTTYDVHMYGTNNCSLATHKTFGLNLQNTEINGIYVGRMEHQNVGFMAIKNCKITGDTILNCSDVITHPDTLLLNCEITGQVNTYSAPNTQRVNFKNCIITRQPRGNLFVGSEKHINCIINIEYLHYLLGSPQFINCTLVSSNSSGIRLHSNNTVHFRNCDIHVDNSPSTQEGELIFNYCKLYNSSFNITDDYIKLYKCKFID